MFRIVKCYLFLIISLFCLSGCGDSPQPPGEKEMEAITGETNENVVSTQLRGAYGIDELNWHVPDLQIKELIAENQQFVSSEYEIYDDTIYRIVTVYNKEDKYRYTQKVFLQKLSAPYEGWNISEMVHKFVANDKEYLITDYYFLKGVPAYCKAFCEEDAVSVDYWVKYDEKSMEILCQMPWILENYEISIDNAGKLYAYQPWGQKLLCLDEELNTEKEIKLSEKISGMIANPDTNNLYSYGHSEGGFGVFDMYGQAVLQNKDVLTSLEYAVDMASTGEFYLADSQKLWGWNQETRLLCDFGMCDYPLEEMIDIEFQKDGSILALGRLDGDYCLMKIVEREQREEHDRQEIIIAFGQNHKGLQKTIGRFNRQNDKYHISIMLPRDGESTLRYLDRIQMEISAGRGPDILSDDFLGDVSGYIDNGYFANLEGIVTDEKDYLQVVLEGGKRNDVLYGMPYDFQLQFASYSTDMTHGRMSWTLSDLMEAVRESDAKILQYGCDGIAIVLWYGLYDNDNKQYIDWENRASHLTEEPFLELLEFAKKYADEEDRSLGMPEEGEMLRTGKAFATVTVMHDLQNLNGLDAAFGGKAANIGFPRINGNGIYAISRYLYVNNASKQKAGVTEFLQFLMSVEEQRRYIMFSLTEAESYIGYKPYLPVSLEAMQNLIMTETNVDTHSKIYYTSDIRGVAYSEESLDATQVAEVNWMLQHAMPNIWNAEQIKDMVAEELQPYFDGERTAQEAARILDNRVQLYLDEQK